eukprot:COSAG02_NODE_330_length_24501_cov_39.465850_21_plen_83_part_00
MYLSCRTVSIAKPDIIELCTSTVYEAIARCTMVKNKGACTRRRGLFSNCANHNYIYCWSRYNQSQVGRLEYVTIMGFSPIIA